MLIIIIGILISLALFYYFQQKQSNRNVEQFEKRRNRYNQMLEQLKKSKEQNGEVSDTTDDQWNYKAGNIIFLKTSLYQNSPSGDGGNRLQNENRF